MGREWVLCIAMLLGISTIVGPAPSLAGCQVCYWCYTATTGYFDCGRTCESYCGWAAIPRVAVMAGQAYDSAFVTFVSARDDVAAGRVDGDADQNAAGTAVQRWYTIGIRVRGEGGAYVIDAVLSGSPAGQAGLQPGDVVIAVEGRSTASMTMDDLIRSLVSDQPVPVTLAVSRQGKGLILSVPRVLYGGHVHQEASGEPEAVFSPYMAGVLVEIRDGRVIIDDIVMNSPADRSGLVPGDEITAVNGNNVSGLTRSQAQALLSSPFPVDVVVTILRKGTPLTRTVRLEHFGNILLRLTIKGKQAPN